MVLAGLLCSCGGSSGGGGFSQTQTPDFSISVTPSSATVPPGGALFAQVSIAPLNEFSGSVTVSIIGLPTGAAASPSSPFIVASGSQGITISVAANAAQGNFTVGLEASSGNLQHSVSLALQVQTQAFASFSLSVDSNQLFFLHGGSANTTVSPTVISSGNANYAVQLSVVGLPPGVQATFGANPFVMGQPSTQLTFTANSSATANYVSVIVVATRTADGVQESAQLEINVSPP